MAPHRPGPARFDRSAWPHWLRLLLGRPAADRRGDYVVVWERASADDDRPATA